MVRETLAELGEKLAAALDRFAAAMADLEWRMADDPEVGE